MSQALPSHVRFTLGKTTEGTEGTQVQAPVIPDPSPLGRCKESTDNIFGQEPMQGGAMAAQAGPAQGMADAPVYSGFTTAVDCWGTGDTAAVKRELNWQPTVGGDSQKIKTF